MALLCGADRARLSSCWAPFVVTGEERPPLRLCLATLPFLLSGEVLLFLADPVDDGVLDVVVSTLLTPVSTLAYRFKLALLHSRAYWKNFCVIEGNSYTVLAALPPKVMSLVNQNGLSQSFF